MKNSTCSDRKGRILWLGWSSSSVRLRFIRWTESRMWKAANWIKHQAIVLSPLQSARLKKKKTFISSARENKPPFDSGVENFGCCGQLQLRDASRWSTRRTHGGAIFCAHSWSQELYRFLLPSHTTIELLTSPPSQMKEYEVCRVQPHGWIQPISKEPCEKCVPGLGAAQAWGLWHWSRFDTWLQVWPLYLTRAGMSLCITTVMQDSGFSAPCAWSIVSFRWTSCHAHHTIAWRCSVRQQWKRAAVSIRIATHPRASETSHNEAQPDN